MVRRAGAFAPWSVSPGGIRGASWISARARVFLRWLPPVCCIARAGNRYRAMVDMCGETECSAEPAGAPGQVTACGWLAASGSSCRRALRSRARQHPGPAAVPDGAPTRDASGTGATAILAGLLRNQVRSVLAAHLRCGLRFEAGLEEGPWATLILRQSIGKKGRKAFEWSLLILYQRSKRLTPVPGLGDLTDRHSRAMSPGLTRPSSTLL